VIQSVSTRWRRLTVNHLARRAFPLPGSAAYVSFTFDDFPLTALTNGGRILRSHGVGGTYFVSFGLLGGDSPSGRIASTTDLHDLLRDGHELGCHTFGHLDGAVVTAAEFERSIEANRDGLAASGLDASFDVFAYPLDGPAIATKQVAGSRFLGCRGGGQTFNHGVVDLSLLKAYFLDARNRDRVDDVVSLLERNAASNGWLIFATHDVDAEPSRYGCESTFFETVVRLAAQSGARVLPMSQVCRELAVTNGRSEVSAR
jgi:peptidoglycan/xylan/chitin deacetylase (PgdA/CDA1 family)